MGSQEDACTPKFLLGLLIIGLVLGFVWEGFEWVIGIIGDRHDTIVDLAMDGLGAILAALLLKLVFAPLGHLAR